MADDPNITTAPLQQTSEVLDSNGNNVSSRSALAAIFENVEKGKPVQEAIKEVVTPPEKVETVVADTIKEEPDVATKPEPAADLDSALTDGAKKKDDKVADDARKALEAKTAAIAEKAAGSGDAVKTPEQLAKEKEDAELEAELKVLPHDKPKTAKRIQALLAKADKINSELVTTKKQAEERATKLKELEEKLGKTTSIDPKVQEEINRQKEELAMFRRKYELEKDPEVKTKFDSRIESAEQSIAETFKGFKNGEDLLKLVSESGGWQKFSESGKKIALGDGKVVSYSELAESVYAELPMTAKRAIDAAVLEQIQSKRDRDRYFQEQTATASDFFKKREEEATKMQQAQAQQVEAARREIEEWQNKTLSTVEWLKDQEVPANATPEQKRAIEENNDYTKQLRGLFKQSMNPKDLKSTLDIVFDSVRYYQERRVSAQKDLMIKQLQADLDAQKAAFEKFKNGNKSVSKAGSISSPAGGSDKTQVKRPASLEEALDMQAAGVDLSGV